VYHQFVALMKLKTNYINQSIIISWFVLL